VRELAPSGYERSGWKNVLETLCALARRAALASLGARWRWAGGAVATVLPEKALEALKRRRA